MTTPAYTAETAPPCLIVRDPWAAPTRRGQPTASHRSLFVELLGTCNLCFDCFASEVGSFGSRSLRFSERGTRLVGPDS